MINEGWERQALQDLLAVSIKEQRSNRRWRIFFRLIGFSCLILFFGVIQHILTAHSKKESLQAPKVAVVELAGQIIADSDRGVDANYVLKGLKKAFQDKYTRAVILRANSPGGSPVQAGILYDEIIQLKKKYPAIPFYVVIEDVCASGCYYVSVAADRIYADKASIIGSIGVLMGGFGFTQAMKKLGIERRLLTAGKNKGFLDPYSAEVPEQRREAEKLLNEIHQQFIHVVKTSRGKRLDTKEDLFSGLVWTGAKAQQLGLIDGLGSISSVARDVVKVDHIVDFTPETNLFDRIARRVDTVVSEKLAKPWYAQAQL